MYSTKFLLVLIAMTLAARAVHAADPAFDPSTFPCPDQRKTRHKLHPPSPPTFSCDENRQKFDGGFHNTCCSKDLDLKKLPQSGPFGKLDRKTFDKFCTDLTP
ncbi:hypothetical protein PSTT_00267, partial [Puccinia striiformis]